MIRSRKTLGNLAVAAGAAAAFLASVLAPGKSSEAGSPAAQEPAKVEVKVEIKEVAKEVKKEVQAEVKAVNKRAAVVRQAQVMQQAGANVEAMAQQFLQNLRPILGVELRFLTSACEPSPAQRREIALEGGRALKQAATKVAEVQLGMNQAVRRGQASLDPRKAIRDAMEAAAKVKLSPEQFARYQRELRARDEDQKEVVVLNLVANLDKLLFLNTDQREKLCSSLTSHWDEKSFPTLENMVIYEAYYPVLPDQSITPILTDEQRKIWRGAQKINFSSIRNFFNNGNGMMNVIVEEDEDERAALAEEVKK